MSARRSVAVPDRSSPDPAVVALRAAVLAAFPGLDELLAQRMAPGAALVDLATYVKPAGVSKRAAYRRARAGAIEGAVLVARRWKAPAEAIDRWLRAKGPRLVNDQVEQGDDLEPIRLRLMAGDRPRRRVRT